GNSLADRALPAAIPDLGRRGVRLRQLSRPDLPWPDRATAKFANRPDPVSVGRTVGLQPPGRFGTGAAAVALAGGRRRTGPVLAAGPADAAAPGRDPGRGVPGRRLLPRAPQLRGQTVRVRPVHGPRPAGPCGELAAAAGTTGPVGLPRPAGA